METIICRCGHEMKDLAKSAVCPSCLERVYTSGEINQMVRELCNQRQALDAQIGILNSELWLRTRRNRAYYFWEQPKPAMEKPKLQTGGKPPGQVSIDLDLADFM